MVSTRSLTSGEIDGLLRKAVTSITEESREQSGRLMARLMGELAERDEDLLLNTYLADHPSQPPTYLVVIRDVDGPPGPAPSPPALSYRSASVAIRRALAAVGGEQDVEVRSLEPDGTVRVLLRAAPHEELVFQVPHEPVGADADDSWAQRLHRWAGSLDTASLSSMDAATHSTDASPTSSASNGHQDDPDAEIGAPSDLRDAAAPSLFDAPVDPLGVTTFGAVGSAHPHPDEGESIATAIGPAVAAAVGPAVRTAVDAAVGPAVQAAVGPALAEAVTASMHGAVDPAVERAVQAAVHQAVQSALHPAVHQAVQGAVQPAVQQAVQAALASVVEQTVEAAIERSVSSALGNVSLQLDTQELSEVVHDAVGGAWGGGDGSESANAPSAEAVSRAVAGRVVPEVEIGLRQLESRVGALLADLPGSAYLDDFRAELRDLSRGLHSAKESFTALHEEVLTSDRRSREQLAEVSRQLSDAVQRLRRHEADPANSTRPRIPMNGD
ncbi:MAG TPA: hypothetical protein VHA73_04750 [Acidimicrobiales bacterium]|jgi:hypothetical protein|nr:hypothetical protein [Acidimicrobiales bacterium]